MGFLKPSPPAMPAIPEPTPLPEPPSFEDEERERDMALIMPPTNAQFNGQHWRNRPLQPA